MSKDLLVLADEYAAATATFARALALKDSADSMSPIARDAGDKRAVLAEALAALDTAQQEPVNAMLVNAMLVEDVNSEIVKRYKVEKTKGGFWPYCVKAGDGTMDLFIGSKRHAGHFQQALQSACLDGAFMAFTAAKQAQPEPFTPDWSQDSAAAESIREHQAICNLLLKEMRHIADISTGQVKRVAEQALEAVKQAQPARPINCGTGHCSCIECPYEQAQPERAPLTCTWTQEDDFDTPGVYHTSCGEMWSFTEGGIKENNTKFCPHCGGGIKQGGQHHG